MKSFAGRLAKVKPLLDDPKHPDWPSITQELTQVASQAESFAEQRPKSSRATWSHLADSLDQEGYFDEPSIQRTRPLNIPSKVLTSGMCLV